MLSHQSGVHHALRCYKAGQLKHATWQQASEGTLSRPYTSVLTSSAWGRPNLPLHVLCRRSALALLRLLLVVAKICSMRCQGLHPLLTMQAPVDMHKPGKLCCRATMLHRSG